MKDARPAGAKTRQKLRKGLILLSFFLFPATFYYLSPVLIVQAAYQGVANGSGLMFSLLFLSALVLGRAFCGWACPGAGCQEALFSVQDKPVTRGNRIKWVLWVPWIGTILFLAARNGGFHKIDFFYQTRYGVSIDSAEALFVYFIVLFLLIIFPALFFGKRSFCHHLCWMAPFMILGEKLRRRLTLPSLHLEADSGKCLNCYACTRNCPMSLPVRAMVKQGKMEDPECILCGTCVDGCEQQAIGYAFFFREKAREGLREEGRKRP